MVPCPPAVYPAVAGARKTAPVVMLRVLMGMRMRWRNEGDQRCESGQNWTWASYSLTERPGFGPSLCCEGYDVRFVGERAAERERDSLNGYSGDVLHFGLMDR